MENTGELVVLESMFGVKGYADTTQQICEHLGKRLKSRPRNIGTEGSIAGSLEYQALQLAPRLKKWWSLLAMLCHHIPLDSTIRIRIRRYS